MRNPEASKLSIGSRVVYDRTWITEGLRDPKNLKPVEGTIVRIGEPFDSGVFNVDVQVLPGDELYRQTPSGGWETVLSTVEYPVVITAPAEYVWHIKQLTYGYLNVFRNHAIRKGYAVARIGFDVLIEYLMPNGTSALNIVDPRALNSPNYRTISYNAIPKKWQKAMEEFGCGKSNMVWNPQ